MIAILDNIRELKDFLASKRIKREPLRWSVKPVACATYIPRNARGFAAFRASLRGVGDWGRASERLDALEHTLRKRHECGLPLPRKVLQNDDRSLTVFWQGTMVRCFPDGFVSTIGGIEGIKARKVTRELLDLLAFQVRIQGAA